MGITEQIIGIMGILLGLSIIYFGADAFFLKPQKCEEALEIDYEIENADCDYFLGTCECREMNCMEATCTKYSQTYYFTLK